MIQTKRLLLLLLALMMVLTTFVACDNTPNNGNEGTTTEAPDDTEGKGDEDDDTETEEKGSILEGVSFEKQNLKVLSWKASNITEYLDTFDENSSDLEQNIYTRCDNTEAELNITTEWFITDGNASHPEFVTTAETANNAGGEYDVIVCYSSFAANLATRGVLANINQYDQYLDFSHDAWPQSLLEDCTINEKLYFCTGDISTNLIFMTSVVFFNKDIVTDRGIYDIISEEYGENDLYGLVTSGKWTLDKMFELSSDVYQDLDESGTKSKGDMFGFGTYDTLLDNFYYGGGYKTVEVDGDEFIISEDYVNVELVSNILYQATDFLFGTDDAFFFGVNAYADVWTSFGSGLTMFSMAPASHAYNMHCNVDGLNYGVLPIPKHSEEQSRYYSVQSFPYSMFCIASKSKNPDISAAFLQMLAEQSHETTRIAMFNKMMKGRYSQEPLDAEMWDYAVDANVFDVGRVFCREFGATTDDQLTVKPFRQRVQNNNANWQAVMASSKKAILGYAAQITENMGALAD